MTIIHFIIRIFVALGFSGLLIFTLAIGIGLPDIKPEEVLTAKIAFCTSLIIFMIFGYLLWVIK